MIWTKDGEELANSRHVQLRERENKTTLQLINLKPSMAGEYRLVVISPLGSDLTFCQLSVTPLHREERQKLQQMQKTGLDQLIRSVWSGLVWSGLVNTFNNLLTCSGQRRRKSLRRKRRN